MSPNLLLKSNKLLEKNNVKDNFTLISVDIWVAAYSYQPANSSGDGRKTNEIGIETSGGQPAADAGFVCRGDQQRQPPGARGGQPEKRPQGDEIGEGRDFLRIGG